MSARGSLVLAFRIVLLLAAAGALLGAVLLGRDHDQDGDARVRYVCPMHAEVTSTARGTCPICGMDLEQVGATGGGALAGVRASTYQTYDTARRRAYGPDMPAAAWVEDDGTVSAILYTDELVAWAPDARAVFSTSSAPGFRTDVRATGEAPEPWDNSTRRVHFRPDTDAPTLHPRDVGSLRLAARFPEPPVIPYSAVLEDAEGPYVLVRSPDGQMLGKRPVQIGRVFGGMAAVVSGLRPTERVLTGSTFFVDAERRLRGETTVEVAPR
jgi:Heavy metal binding domain